MQKMKNSKKLFKQTFIAALVLMHASSSWAQDVTELQTATQAEMKQEVQFELQYEDAGIKVFIPKLFPKYQMKEGQEVAGFLFASRDAAFKETFINAGFIPDTHRAFHSVSDDAPDIALQTVRAGTRAQIAYFLENQNNSSNKIISSIGAVAMFALTRGSSSGAMANLGALKNVTGSGMLGAANFKDTTISGGDSKSIASADDDIVYILQVGLKRDQSAKVEQQLVFFVLPNEMKSEIFKGNKLINYFEKYGPSFSGVISRAVLKTTNLISPMMSGK
jgi:hypothetical protein